MAKPPLLVREALQAALAKHGLDQRLGGELFPPEHWHQSLSNRYADNAATRASLRRIGEQTVANAFPMSFNRVRGNAEMEGRIHWSFVAHGTPRGLSELLAVIQSGLDSAGLAAGNSHTPHLTISYGAPERLDTLQIDPVLWQVEEFCLVERGGSPFGYRDIATWPLRPLHEAVGYQPPLF